MLWAALLLSADGSPPPPDAQRGLATWALQFSPQVASVDEAIVMEVQASLRLFGGADALRERVRDGALELDVVGIGWAPTSLAALACARAGVDPASDAVPAAILDPLPFGVVSATRTHATTLQQLGCRRLADVRALPRGGISRRFGRGLLAALDQAYGERPESYDWISLPEDFHARLELPSRVDVAPAMLFGARRLVVQMAGWLAAKHAGTTAIVLRWLHDSMRSKEAGAGGELTVRTAEPTRDVEHLCRLLAEHLAKTTMLAPAGELSLEAKEVVELEERSASFLPDPAQDHEPVGLVLERIAARLGPARVKRPVAVEDHRLEWAEHWQPAADKLPRRRARPQRIPQPTYLFEKPLRLHTRDHRPQYQGDLQIQAGPHRIEGGWWHRTGTSPDANANNVQRDYFVARSAHAGLLWIFQERLAGDESAWFLHGTFA